MFANGQVAMMIGPNQISKYCESVENPINYGVASLPVNGDVAGASVGVMDRIMCFAEEGRSEAELAAITKVVDAFYDDEPYAEWVLMENFIPATIPGGELCIEANPDMEKWVNLVAGAQFYPSIEGWDEVKFGVIDAQQQMLLGEDIQEVLDILQEEVAG